MDSAYNLSMIGLVSDSIELSFESVTAILCQVSVQICGSLQNFHGKLVYRRSNMQLVFIFSFARTSVLLNPRSLCVVSVFEYSFPF